MSSNITITDELVAEIANRMADEGQKVSPVAIWSEVHSGSVVAVSAALRKWRETRAARVPQVVERPALPETVTDTMREALDRLWTSAQDEAERSVARRLAAMRQRVEDASNERDEALAELQTTVQELDALQVQLDKMTSAYDEKVDAVAGLEEDIALAVQRTDAAEKRAQELADRVSHLEAELERAEQAAGRGAIAGDESDAAGESEVASESAESVVETPAGEAERAALEAEHAEAVARLQSELEAIRAELQAEQDAAALELQNAQTLIASLTDERDADASEIARLSASLSEAQQRADAEQQRAAELAESAAASEQVEDVESASPAGVDSQELEALKAQMSRDAEAHAAAIAEARETVRKWSDYSNALKQQLTQANEKMVVVLARGAGEATLSRRLTAELSQVKPEHELLRKEIQQQVIVETITAHLEKQGYRYDEQTGAVSKLNAESSPA
ncbi:DNA-binding protein [Paraburkholderia atlantica]|uniref:DNA-binding protein n=1 Tax=Paraburkholderia atlantica TaxID=2654982 RepID=UPI001614C237|nr:DNA-binding protein [Paraburkholderia atlantica]MBB5510091.1 chromosome segregation ATPase [Paraburkholderia atlantica]